AGLGGKIGATGDVDYSEVQASALSRFWRELLELTAEMALSPALLPAEVDNERAYLLSRVQKRRDAPYSRAIDELYKTRYVADPTSAAAVAATHRILVEQPAQQAQILVGGLAPRIADADFAAVKVLANVLGGGMAGRLFAELRDKQALAYTASAYFDPMRDP